MDETRVSSGGSEELASALLLAEAEDRASLEALARAIEDFASQGGENDRRAAAPILESVRRILEGAEPDLDSALAKVRREAERLLEESGAEGKIGGQGTGDASGSFVLPEWVEEEVFQEFLAGAEDELAEIESLAMDMEEKPEAALPALKRKIHTFKGEAGLLGMEALEKVCHALETFLEDHVPTSETVDRILGVKDWISRAVTAYEKKAHPPPPPEELLAGLEGRESGPTGGKIPPHGNPAAPPRDETEGEEAGEEEKEKEEGRAAEEDWDEESLSLAEEFIQESGEGLSNVDEILLASEGEALESDQVDALFRVFHTIKGLAGFLELQDITRLAHTTEALLDQARKGFMKIQGPLSDLLFDSTEMMRSLLKGLEHAVSRGKKPAPREDLEELTSRIENATAGKLRAEPLPPTTPGKKLGEILTDQPDALDGKALEKALERQKETGTPLGVELVQSGAVPAKKVSQALRAQKQARNPGAPSKLREFVKVDLQRVDTLVSLVGELVIAETMVVNAPELAEIVSPRLRKQIAQMSRITSDLQDIATRMRMVPVRDVFQKAARMVRDLSRKTGKAVKTEIEGAATEIDRGMVEQLGDPLVHIIRNAVDHGIEPPEEREKAGKPPTGTIFLRARHQGGNVVIEVADDGKGLNREAILAKAREKGLVGEGENLPDQEVFNLIFAPGFSTAPKLTEISGRGVGMDVVKRNIESIRGSVSITSVPGEGTTIQLILPLTMAIIDGMLVTCGGERYIIPTLSVVESIKPDPGMIFSIAGKREILSVRGETYPLFRLDRLLGIPGAVQDPVEALGVVVESHGKRVGILVDDVLTQQQVVIKGLGNGLPNTGYLSGAAILSDGRVGLILNMAEITALKEIPPAETGASSAGGRGGLGESAKEGMEGNEGPVGAGTGESPVPEEVKE